MLDSFCFQKILKEELIVAEYGTPLTHKDKIEKPMPWYNASKPVSG